MKTENGNITSDELECTQCGRIVLAECRTEMELELETCSEKCSAGAVFQLSSELREAVRQRAQFLGRINSLGRTCAALDETAGNESAFRRGCLIRFIAGTVRELALLMKAAA